MVEKPNDTVNKKQYDMCYCPSVTAIGPEVGYVYNVNCTGMMFVELQDIDASPKLHTLTKTHIIQSDSSEIWHSQILS